MTVGVGLILPLSSAGAMQQVAKSAGRAAALSEDAQTACVIDGATLDS